MKKQEDEFYLCIYKENGNFIGHVVSNEGEFPSKLKVVPEKSERVRERRRQEELDSKAFTNPSDIDKIFSQFVNSMVGYMEILPMISSLVPNMSSFSTMKGVIGFAKKCGEKVETCEDYDLFIIKDDSKHAFFKMMQKISISSMVGRQIPKMLIIGIVSSYEHHFSLVIREIFKKNPEKIESSRKEFTVQEVFKSSSLDEFRESILEREVDSIIRESFVEQISWIERTLTIQPPIGSKHNGWDELVEIFERRNIYAHANGIVNSQYLRRSSAAKVKYGAVKGEELTADGRYIGASIEAICEFGVKLIQIAWRKIEKDQETVASQRLGEFCYNLICQGKYTLAIRLLEFATSLRDLSSEQRKRINLVNLANAYKLTGDNDKALEIINSVDWNFANYEFQISVAAIKGNDSQVISLMEKVSQSENFESKNFEEWPLFAGLREDTAFKSEFERIYSRPMNIPSKKKVSIFDVSDSQISSSKKIGSKENSDTQ
ncbi:hypothetical protein [Aureimonas sp. Leaf454]|uniref:hypothetical protein n=1 Tax=Aureimonas sp. Leaf454 TaxID=1736381 RepID=UPI000AE5B8A3|nr:hypothetical protein [Aureimonas sp. Leaf454]